jgi:hypothetical protein
MPVSDGHQWLVEVTYHPCSQATSASDQGGCRWGVGGFNSRHLHDNFRLLTWTFVQVRPRQDTNRTPVPRRKWP